MNRKTLDTFLALVGIAALIPGLLEILFGLTGETYTWEILNFGGDFTLWRGLILSSTGTLFLLAVNQPNLVQKRAQAILASAMIWIVGGIEIFSTVLNSITGGGGTWINSPQNFFGYYSRPFTPSVLLIPISILLVLLITSSEVEHD